MNCPNCSAPNVEWAKFCKNCGTGLPGAASVAATTDMVVKKDLYLVLGYIGLQLFTVIYYTISNRFIVPGLLMDSSSSAIRSYYATLHWVTYGLDVSYLLVALLLIKHNTARVVMIIFFVIQLLLMVINGFSW